MDTPQSPGLEALEALFKRNPSLVEANPAIVKDVATGMGVTALHRCAEGDSFDLMKRLVVEGGLDIHAKDERGDTPLHYAAAANASKESSWLIEQGASVDAVNTKDETPMHHAAQARAITAMTVLLEAKADIDAVNEDGKTPIDITEDVGLGSLARSIRAKVVAEQAMREIEAAPAPGRN